MDFGRSFAEIDSALASGEIDEAAWYDLVRDLIERAYLATDDPQEQSGLGGDTAHWERRRRVLVEAIDRDGTFLDVGCANGLLMETLVAWAGERGYRLEPYGLDISPKLTALARARLPQKAEQIFTGNIIDWEPPRCFDYVFTGLEYVPEVRQPDLVARLRSRIVAPGGRLVITSYRARGTAEAEPLAERLRTWGVPISGEAVAIDDATGGVATRIVWSDTTPR
jgi:SAM-dependent methyltransferase